MSRSELASVLESLAEIPGLDFSDYRETHVARALQMRMAARGITSARAYRDLVADDAAERERLLSALLVPVTSLFRDREVFDALCDLVHARTAGVRSPTPFRAWAIGVASGEEAWSLAAVLAHACERGVGYEILATDADLASLAAAGRGQYPVSIEAVPARYRRFFETRDTGDLAAKQSLRPHVSFACHDIVGTTIAPPEALIAAFGLVLLRNVLIYYDRRLQETVLARIGSVLDAGGLLVLGHVETLPGDLAGDFEPHPAVDPRLRIFRRR